MVYLMNPVVGMLHNTKTNRWHPVIFQESSLPGPHSPSKPVRLKSVGHHTAGFDKREDALRDIEEKSQQMDPKPLVDVTEDIKWDGESIPAMVGFLTDGSLSL